MMAVRWAKIKPQGMYQDKRSKYKEKIKENIS